MWASAATFEVACGSKVLSVDWKQSTDGQGGWLVTSGSEGTVGVSWIAHRGAETANVNGAGVDNVACSEGACMFKSHFNLRGHSGKVRLVRWAPSGQRLASYDSWGKIILWKNRANILACDFEITTNSLVTDMQWSPCGYNVIICGKEGHIQLFSGLSGVVFFSIQLCAPRLQDFRATLSSCAWNRLGNQVALATEKGEVMLLDPTSNGQLLSTLTLREGVAVGDIEWFGPPRSCQTKHEKDYHWQKLTAYLKNGEVVFFSDYSPPTCVSTKTSIIDGRAKWSSNSKILAVVGHSATSSTPLVQLLNTKGDVTATVHQALPAFAVTHQLRVHSFAWSLEDSTLIIMQGANMFSMTVKHRIPKLQHLCREAIAQFALGSAGERRVRSAASSRLCLSCLPLPKREVDILVSSRSALIPAPLDTHSARALESLLDSVPCEQRHHCIIEAMDPSSGRSGYTVKMEFCNQYVPILEATRRPRNASKFLTSGFIVRPAFNFNCASSTQRDGCRAVSNHWMNVPFELTVPDQDCPGTSSEQQTSPAPRSFLKQLCSTFHSGFRRSVVDAAHEQVSQSTPATIFHSMQPVLAEVNGSAVTNRYQFSSPSRSFQEGSLGTLCILSSLVNCKPRRITLTLQTAGGATPPLMLESKKPDWNERHQIYELDFGGRVNRDSVKNYQIDQNGQVVLQFGRIDSARFCLDFQAPFSIVQAACVALSCIL